MNPRERGFLLLTSRLGNPDRRVLTAQQLRVLAQRVQGRTISGPDRDLTEADLVALGYGRDQAGRIVALLEEEALLDRYLQRGKQAGCVPLSRVSAGYPAVLRKRLGGEAPGCLWARGDLSLLDTPAIALVGSRDLGARNRDFAQAVGMQAARQGLTLVSGNARGADRTAQENCLAAGGRVISIVADELDKQPLEKNQLFLSEDGFHESFSAQRALSRNRIIHAMGRMVFVAQATLEKGGTWDGTVKNLRFGWSPVACFDDGSEAAARLTQMGAFLVAPEVLKDLEGLAQPEKNFFDP